MNKPNPAYMGDAPFVFISYSHADEAEVFPEVSWLQAHELNVWWDEGIGGGSRWRDEIAGRINDCSFLLFYVSDQSVQSSVCREELEYALAHDKPILLVHLSDTELPQGIKLAASNRQALYRYKLEQAEYERKLLDATTHLLGQDPVEPRSGISRSIAAGKLVGVLTVIFALLLVSSVLLTWWLVKPGEPEAKPSARFSQLLPASFAGAGSTHLTINGAGTHIFAIGSPGYPDKEIFVRPLKALTFEPVPDSNLERDFFGVIPDHSGTNLLLAMQEGKLARMSSSGGQVIPLLTSRNSVFRFHARWSGPETVLLQDKEDIVEVTWRDGTVRQRTLIQGGAHPFPIPGTDRILYAKLPAQGVNSSPVIFSHDLTTGEEMALIEGTDPRLTPAGHLLYFASNAVWAVRFDQDRLQVQGEPVKVLEDVVSGVSKAQYEFADTGTMVYLPPFVAQQGLYWVSRDGLERRVNMSLQGEFGSFGLSPDEKTVALGGRGELLLFSFEDELITRLTMAQGGTISPVWLNNGQSIVFGEYLFGGIFRAHMVSVDTQQTKMLAETKQAIRPLAHLPASNQMLVEVCESFKLNCDIARLDLSGSGNIEPVLDSDFHEISADISPNGRHIAYISNEFGPPRVVVRPYPDVWSAFKQVPMDNCDSVSWTKAGRELIIECGTGRYSVPVEFSPALKFGEPKFLFDSGKRYFQAQFAESRGQFLMIRQENVNNLFVVVLNWFDELDRLLPQR